MLSFPAFAAKCGAPETTARGWIDGNVLPRAFYLNGIAEGFDVTPSWVLGISGEPKHRGQSLTNPEIEVELRAVVTRHVKARGIGEPWMFATLAGKVEAAPLLDNLCAVAAEDCTAHAHWLAAKDLAAEALSDLKGSARAKTRAALEEMFAAAPSGPYRVLGKRR